MNLKPKRIYDRVPAIHQPDDCERPFGSEQDSYDLLIAHLSSR
jgi:hypothetical protein